MKEVRLMIRLEKINKSFQHSHILKDMSLDVPKGSIYGLVGTNGAGKTTIIKHITGILKPDSGSLTIGGSPVFENTAVKSRIGYISDDLYFFATYSLKEMARFYKKMYPGWNQERYQNLLHTFKLDEKSRLGRFSKGMQKQAAFVLVMSTMPDYLILDEPLDGLDPIARKVVWKHIVEDVAERETTVLVSSHNLRDLEGICDRIGIIADGHMVIERDLDDLKSDIHKLQLAYPEGTNPPYDKLQIIFRQKRGTVELLIVRDNYQHIEEVIGDTKPLIFDVLPLTLEEIFIYELGGDENDIKEIIF